MHMNHVDRPSKQALTEIMRKVNAYGHAPRVIVELDKFSYVPGLKKKYNVVEFITKQVTQNIVSVSYPSGGGGELHMNAPAMPIGGKTSYSELVITSKHRTENPERPKHKGLDIDLAIGDPVMAVWDGTVTEYNFDSDGYGHYVTIDHGNGIKTRYAHLSGASVSVGDFVKAGSRIASGGNSGRVRSTTGDGSHLHFEVWKDGVDINPAPVLRGEVVVNGVTKGAKTTTITETTEKVSYYRDLTVSSPDEKFVYYDATYFTASTPQGARRMFGFQGTSYPNQQKVFTFSHNWFNEGYMQFSFLYEKRVPGDIIELLMDGNVIWSLNGDSTSGGVINVAPLTITKGNHLFQFRMKNTSASSSKFGLMSMKCAEFDQIGKQVVVPTNGIESGYTSSAWDYEDGMDNLGKWSVQGSVVNGGDYFKIPSDAEISRSVGMGFPLSAQFTVKVDSDVSKGITTVSNGNVSFNVGFFPDRTVTDRNGTAYPIDNTTWQTYMVVAKNETDAVLFVKRGGTWDDTGLTPTLTEGISKTIRFYTESGGTGSLYVDEVKYANRDFSTTAPTIKVEMKTTPTWYDLGGFVFDETFYLESDIMSWEVSTHLDMSSSTARVTLSNHHGLYSPEYVRDPAFPNNLRKNPMSYYEQGEIRHVISEYTPVRIYAGYGDQVVRVFTGMIKGEVEEDSEERTITFNCVDRYDLLEECVLLRPMQFPPEEAFGGDNTPRPWIKSSIVQALANHAGMTGWRYVYEDLMHPDLVIEETYYTDIHQANNTFMKFDSKGQIQEVSLGDVKSPSGYKNPFVEAILFQAGERVSDCIRRIVDEINFRAYVNRYGTFVMHRLDFDNNMRWEFRSGENLYGLNTATDYSRVRNHIIVTGSHGNQEHFFDKDLIVATKGHIRTTQLDCPWIDETNNVSARGAKQVVADKLFFDMKRQARTKSVVVKGNPYIEVLDGCYVYDTNTSTSGYYIIKGNTLIGDSNGMINQLELTWEEKVA